MDTDEGNELGRRQKIEKGGPSLSLTCWVSLLPSVPQIPVCQLTGLQKTRGHRLEALGLLLACRHFDLQRVFFHWVDFHRPSPITGRCLHKHRDVLEESEGLRILGSQAHSATLCLSCHSHPFRGGTLFPAHHRPTPPCHSPPP